MEYKMNEESNYKNLPKAQLLTLEVVQKYINDNGTLPSLLEIAEIRGVNRITVRETLGSLIKKGYVIKANKGRFVFYDTVNHIQFKEGCKEGYEEKDPNKDPNNEKKEESTTLLSKFCKIVGL